MSVTGWLRVPDPARDLHTRFESARPFPHVVLDDTLARDAGCVAAEFPAADWSGWRQHTDGYQRNKLVCSDITAIPPGLTRLLHELQAPPFLEFLEAVTGVRRLIPDPYLEGGGLHASGAGGYLAPHTDFHVYTRLGLFRQLNVLLYLNESWADAAGGALELFEPGEDTPTVRISPSWGRMVIFRTDDRATHGFTEPVAVGSVRRSIALYYYTAAETEGFAGDTNTYWKAHGDMRSGSRRLRFFGYRALLAGSRALSLLAHRCNPNLGSRLRPTDQSVDDRAQRE
jgi:2OG-Fe(II) oxygenase superfamily